MKKILFLLVFLILQGCAVYPPYGPRVAYNSYHYGHGGHSGWGRYHGWGGGRHGWGGGHYHD